MAGTIVANTLNTDAGVFNTLNAYNGIAKAWVIFNGSTLAISNSFNVSSVTSRGTGQYTINFANNMANANYLYSVCELGSADHVFYSTTQNVAYLYVNCDLSTNGSAQNAIVAGVAVFGN
jgi:hypothetical protein